MNIGYEKLKQFIKKETVLCIAVILAVVSAFIVPPDGAYIGYIDFRTLAILFCLMSVMAGLQKIGLFHQIAAKLLKRVKSRLGIVLILVLLCFFFSMVITNDVALITFVPFTFTVLGLLGENQRRKLVLSVVVMQTIAANLGSMLTPVGNPQNLYLYGKAGISIKEFFLLMLPYTVVSLALLAAWCIVIGRQGKGAESGSRTADSIVHKGAEPGVSAEDSIIHKSGQSDNVSQNRNRKYLVAYLVLFLLSILVVGHILSWQAALAIVLVTVFVMDRQVLLRVDYSLLLTFVGFFVFIGNLGRISVFRDFLQGILAGNEVYTAIVVSQVISNVPAALLLSGFTENFAELIVGANLGGLGTLIASMASLISYKYVAKEESGRKGAYIGLFTAANMVFLAVLIVLYEGMKWG